MKNTGIKQEVINEICHIAKKHQVSKVVLFGSRARGTYQRASDIDLAVLGGDFDSFVVEIKEETSTLLDFDIVDLEQNLQDKLLQSIEKEGVMLYEEI